MRTSIVNLFGTSALIGLALASSPMAQVKATPLSATEVQQLITRGQPDDHARLSAHFAALADQQAAEAKRHAAMQQAYSDSKKAAAVSMAAHCRQLAARGQQSAASLRELSAFHATQAGGATAAAASIDATGRGPSDADLVRLAGGAASAADHRALETYFTSLAARHEREAADHAAYAKTWKGLTRNASAGTQAALHDREATAHRELAAEARAAAAMHRDQAAAAK